MRKLKIPSVSRIERLEAFLHNFYTKEAISEEDLEHAYTIFQRFRTKLSEKHKNKYEANIIGSMFYGICYKDTQCDISIKLSSPSSIKTSSGEKATNLPNIMEIVLEILCVEMPDCLTIIRGNKEEKHSVAKSLSNDMIFNFRTGL